MDQKITAVIDIKMQTTCVKVRTNGAMMILEKAIAMGGEEG